METSVDGTYGNGGGSGWNMSASIVDGCDGKGGVNGWTMVAATKDAWNNKYARSG